MPEIRKRWLKRIGVGLLLLLLVPLAVVGAGYLAFEAILSGNSMDFGIAQDCAGVSVIISGEVKDAGGQPITNARVVVNKFPADTNQDFELALQSDGNGYFTASKPLSIFFCDDLTFNVSADDGGAGLNKYEKIQITYSLAQNYLDEPLLPNPIPVRIFVTLANKLEVTNEPSV